MRGVRGMRLVISVAVFLCLFSGCASKVETFGYDIKSVTSGKRPPVPSPEPRAGEWGRHRQADFALRNGMLKYYERSPQSLDWFTRCLVFEYTNSSCMFGAGLYYGDVNGDFVNAIRLLELVSKNSLKLSSVREVLREYHSISDSVATDSSCRLLSRVVDSVTMIGLWRDRRLLASKRYDRLCKDFDKGSFEGGKQLGLLK